MYDTVTELTDAARHFFIMRIMYISLEAKRSAEVCLTCPWHVEARSQCLAPSTLPHDPWQLHMLLPNSNIAAAAAAAAALLLLLLLLLHQ